MDKIKLWIIWDYKKSVQYFDSKHRSIRYGIFNYFIKSSSLKILLSVECSVEIEILFAVESYTFNLSTLHQVKRSVLFHVCRHSPLEERKSKIYQRPNLLFALCSLDSGNSQDDTLFRSNLLESVGHSNTCHLEWLTFKGRRWRNVRFWKQLIQKSK